VKGSLNLNKGKISLKLDLDFDFYLCFPSFRSWRYVLNIWLNGLGPKF